MKTIVVLGRPNVGKSSLFNRLVGHKRALVLNTPGVTRDRVIETTTWNRANAPTVRVIDTGGIGDGPWQDEIKMQVETALEGADLALFVVDGRIGVHDLDREVLQALRKAGVMSRMPVFCIINKIDREPDDDVIAEFHQFALDHYFTISAEHDLGVEDLKDEILELWKNDKLYREAKEKKYSMPSIAIVGQPNVGKSTLLNAIVGETRAITSPIPGTTVDPVDSLVEWDGHRYILIDTAGIRRKSKTEEGIEVLSVVQTRKILEKADLAFLVLDGEKGISDQDEKIGGLIEEAGCSVILVLNKWDTQKDNTDFKQGDAEERIRKQIRFLQYAPLVFTTAIEGLGVDRLFRTAVRVLKERELKLTTNVLTEFVRAESEIHNPMDAKFYLVQQMGRHPPRFVAHVNDPQKIHFSLSRHLVRAIRDRFGYIGTPIRFECVKRGSSQTNDSTN